MEWNNLMELMDLVVWNYTNNSIGRSDEATGIELMEWVVLTESMKLMKLMAWKQGRNVNWFMEIVAVMKQIESIELMESFNLVEQ